MISPGLNLIEKLIIKAKEALINPAIIAREIELKEVCQLIKLFFIF